MRQDRSRLRIGVGDSLELAGAAGACLAVGHLAGLWWGVLLGAALAVAAAEFIYDGTVLRVPLPRRPRVVDARVRAQRLALWLRRARS